MCTHNCEQAALPECFSGLCLRLPARMTGMIHGKRCCRAWLSGVRLRRFTLSVRSSKRIVDCLQGKQDLRDVDWPTWGEVKTYFPLSVRRPQKQGTSNLETLKRTALLPVANTV